MVEGERCWIVTREADEAVVKQLCLVGQPSHRRNSKTRAPRAVTADLTADQQMRRAQQSTY